MGTPRGEIGRSEVGKVAVSDDGLEVDAYPVLLFPGGDDEPVFHGAGGCAKEADRLSIRSRTGGGPGREGAGDDYDLSTVCSYPLDVPDQPRHKARVQIWRGDDEPFYRGAADLGYRVKRLDGTATGPATSREVIQRAAQERGNRQDELAPFIRAQFGECLCLPQPNGGQRGDGTRRL